jgi:hypothetical protein
MRSFVFRLVSGFLVLSFPAWVTAGPQVLGRFDFEKEGLAGWAQSKDLAEGTDIAGIDRRQFHSGAASLTFRLPAGGSKMLYRCFTFPAVKDPVERTFRIRLFVRSEGMKKDGISVRVLLGYGNQRPPAWYEKSPFDDQPFLILPASSAWTEVQGEGYLPPEVTDFSLYLIAGRESGVGQVWFDDLTVELLDRGVKFQCDKKGNIFVGESGKMNLLIRGSDEIASGQVTLTDEEKKILKVIPIQKGQDKIEIIFSTRGFYEVTAQVAYRDGVTRWKQTKAAVVGPLIPDELRMKSPFGFYSWVEGLSVAAGARWERTNIVHNESQYTDAAKAGFPITPRPAIVPREKKTQIYCLARQAEWLQKRKSKTPWEDSWYYPVNDEKKFKDLTRYTMKMALAQVPEYYETGNELDGAWKGSMKELVEFHRQSAEAVKAVNPDAKILGPCACSIKTDWLEMLRNLGMFKYLDGLVVHAYVNATPPEEEFIQKVRDLKGYMRSIGKADMPIYITEYGWTLPPGDWQKPVDPLTQARYVSRSLILLVAEQIHAFTYFYMYMHTHNSADGYALMENDYTPRPGYAAYANAARFLTGVTGPGRVFSVTPTAYLALFAKDNGTVAAAWDVKAPSKVFIPRSWRTGRDMMGRAVKEPQKDLLTVGPSPVFIELPDVSFYRMKEEKKIRIGQGREIRLPWTPVWMPDLFTVEGQRLKIPADARKGSYLLIGKDSEGWRCIRVEVIAPLEVISTKIVWPLNQSRPVLKATLYSDLSTPLDLGGKMMLPGVSTTPLPAVRLLSKTATQVTLPLPDLEPGKRYIGKALLEGQGKRLQVPVDVTAVPCLPLRGSSLDKLPAMDLSAWGPFTFTGGEYKPYMIRPEDCSATLRMGYDDLGLHFRIDVRDNIHDQSRTAKEMWMGDSVQLAFDMDAEKPWRVNEGGSSGHFKVYEYGFGLGEKGPMNWRWVSFDKSLPFDVVESRIQTRITRQKEITTYDLVLPWSALGQTEPPKPGTGIGFSLVINDKDGASTDRKGLKLFNGILDSKDPKEYGWLWIR